MSGYPPPPDPHPPTASYPSPRMYPREEVIWDRPGSPLGLLLSPTRIFGGGGVYYLIKRSEAIRGSGEDLTVMTEPVSEFQPLHPAHPARHLRQQPTLL